MPILVKCIQVNVHSPIGIKTTNTHVLSYVVAMVFIFVNKRMLCVYCVCFDIADLYFRRVVSFQCRNKIEVKKRKKKKFNNVFVSSLSIVVIIYFKEMLFVF